jgi:DNA-binding response OmpR family regulator
MAHAPVDRKPRLLVVDDESDLLAELKPLLERSGFVVNTILDGVTALRQIEQDPPHLVILDILLPNMSGRDILRHLRQQNNWVPVILLTQVTTPMERIVSLQEGADDYINKPFDPFELIARIQSVLRRTSMNAHSLVGYQKLSCGDLLLNRTSRQATFSGRTLTLTARAFGVLEYLMLNTGTIISRDRLLDQVWGWSNPIESRAVDIRVAEIRKALNDTADHPQYIETVVGSGYRFLGEVRGLA